MKIKFSDTYGNDVTYELNDSELAHALERQLPLKVTMNQYRKSAKGFTPNKKLNTFGAPLSKGGTEGICYYKPDNIVALYHGDYVGRDDLYVLGDCVAGQGAVRNLKGDILIEEIF